MRDSGQEEGAEAWVLTTDEGRALLRDVGAVAAPGPAAVARWRARAGPEQVAAALRIAEARRRGASKLERADRMWLEPKGVEQATSGPVARHKAARFAGRAEVVVDLCCGVGGDALAIAGTSGARVLAVDCDRVVCRRAHWNAGVHDLAERVLVVQSRAETFGRPAGAWIHIDPDRRARGTARAKEIAGYEPGLAFLRGLAHGSPGGAIKLGPASDFADPFGGEGFEVEVVSLAGECKEATVWFGAAATCRRRATRLPSGASWTDRDGEAGAAVGLGPPGAWVFDPDAALVRAGLVDAFAAAHHLRRFAAGVDYLTGPDRVASPFLSAFAVLAVLPLDLKQVKRELVARGVGPLEVKTRGVAHRPEALRAAMRLSGDHSATLLLAGGPGPAWAVIARRIAEGQ